MTLQIAAIPLTVDIQAALFDLGKVQPNPQRSSDVAGFDEEHPIVPTAPMSSPGESELTSEHKRAIQEALRKLLRSPLLIQSTRLCRFLSFAVETTLKGEGGSLKEYAIGIAAYGRREDFDPTQDSIVRTEARRLRTKLKEYYLQEGAADPIVIYFRPGSYAPVFQVNEAAKQRALEICKSGRSSPSQSPSLFVVPFSHVSGDNFGEACARGLTDEFMHCLSTSQDLRVFTSTVVRPDSAAEDRWDRRHGVRVSFEGNVRTEGHHIRVTSRIYDADGLHIASWRVDAEITPGGLFADLEKIALEIATCMQRHSLGIAVS